MPREAFDQRLLPRLQGSYFSEHATIQTLSQAQQTNGEMIDSYTTAVENVPCAVRIGPGSETGGEYVAAKVAYRILMQGSYASLVPSARLLIDGVAYDIIAVETDPYKQLSSVIAHRCS